MAKKSEKKGLKLYQSYMFRDKDPVIDIMRTAINGEKFSAVSERSGVSATTLHNWFHGTTRRPQFATVQAVARVVGMSFELQKQKQTSERINVRPRVVSVAKQKVG